MKSSNKISSPSSQDSKGTISFGGILRAAPLAIFFCICNFLAAAPGASVPAPKPGPAQPKTSITSETLEMVSGPVDNTFYFSKNVVVNGNNLKMTADQMVVTAKRAPEGANTTANAPANNLNAPGGSTIDKIVAVGNVRLYQEGRESFSGRAEFYPKEGKVVLTEKPRVIDAKAIVSGWRITLYQGERKVMVEQDPAQGGARPSVNLDSMPNLGFDPKSEPPAPPPPPAPAHTLPGAPVTTLNLSSAPSTPAAPASTLAK